MFSCLSTHVVQMTLRLWYLCVNVSSKSQNAQSTCTTCADSLSLQPPVPPEPLHEDKQEEEEEQIPVPDEVPILSMGTDQIAAWTSIKEILA